MALAFWFDSPRAQNLGPMVENRLLRLPERVGGCFAWMIICKTAKPASESSGASEGQSYTAGHASGATTMAYAVVQDAKEVKGRINIDY